MGTRSALARLRPFPEMRGWRFRVGRVPGWLRGTAVFPGIPPWHIFGS
jgi:hypothetical protein